jgi:Zn finger protein HypA/HybF involved in hydrogenase expression
MGNVVSFPGKQEVPVQEEKAEEPKTTKWLAGSATCIGCQHEWEQVAPLETATSEFLCPKCHTMKGRLKYEFMPPDGLLYRCGCGNYYMYVTPEGLFCPNCARRAEFQ